MRRPIKHWTVVFAAAVPFGFAAAGRSAQQTEAAEPAGSADQPLATQPPAFTAAPLDSMSAPMPYRTPPPSHTGGRPPR
jgi:hypothetical protein